eukprot:TRINITY_DN84038_c0_g1_i1.p1 TRINITY_DN84038_c0_g1~~TRINITY_DN84038_c0_g1_i1.p1  ORF type:complete len:159 (-),score=15.66 TRINITY_DN84038_c0_g1_i1:94-516(-)
MSAHTWTQPGSIRAAGSIVYTGKGPRADLQDQYTYRECEDGLQSLSLFAFGGKMDDLMRSSRLDSIARRRMPQNGVERFLSYNPNPGDDFGRRSTRLDPSMVAAAGSVSYCESFDKIRQLQYRRELRQAVKNNEVAACRR